MTAFSFWSGHSSGMTVHILCLPLRQSPDNWCPSPSQWGLYLCHCHYSSSVLLCSPERRDCPDLWTRLAGVHGDCGPGVKRDLRDGAVLMLWVLHVILSQALQPSTIARNWARSLCWEIRLLRSLAALGLVYVLGSGPGGNPNSCFHCLADPLVLHCSCLLTLCRLSSSLSKALSFSASSFISWPCSWFALWFGVALISPFSWAYFLSGALGWSVLGDWLLILSFLSLSGWCHPSCSHHV